MHLDTAWGFQMVVHNYYKSFISNGLLFIIIAQEATKVWPVKFGGPQKLPYASAFLLNKSDSIPLVQELQLLKVTILHLLKLW